MHIMVSDHSNFTALLNIISFHQATILTSPDILSSAVSSLGVHCRLTMYILGRFRFGRSIHQRQGYCLRIFRLVPRHNIISADSAADLASSQLYGQLIAPWRENINKMIKQERKNIYISKRVIPSLNKELNERATPVKVLHVYVKPRTNRIISVLQTYFMHNIYLGVPVKIS